MMIGARMTDYMLMLECTLYEVDKKEKKDRVLAFPQNKKIYVCGMFSLVCHSNRFKWHRSKI